MGCAAGACEGHLKLLAFGCPSSAVSIPVLNRLALEQTPRSPVHFAPGSVNQQSQCCPPGPTPAPLL